MAAGTRITFPENMRMIRKTIKPTDWSGSGLGPFTYSVSGLGTTANTMIFVHNDMGLTKEEIEAFGKSCITASAQVAGGFTLKALNKPEKDLKIVIEIGGECI